MNAGDGGWVRKGSLRMTRVYLSEIDETMESFGEDKRRKKEKL